MNANSSIKRDIASILSKYRATNAQSGKVESAIEQKLRKLMPLCQEGYGKEPPFIVLKEILSKTAIVQEEGEVRFCPDIEEAILYLGSDKAIRLFEDGDLSDLFIKSEIIRHLTAPGSYFYTTEEVLNLLQEYKSHLEMNKDFLLKTGFPLH